jgi:predicted transcriptional regulator
MGTPKWNPSDDEREVMETVWMQVKGACEKLKEETNAQDEQIRKMLQEMADRYYS